MSERYLKVHQSREHEPTDYELKLAGTIEEVFATGTHDLPGLVEGLRSRGLLAPDGSEWTESSFCSEMARLGA